MRPVGAVLAVAVAVAVAGAGNGCAGTRATMPLGARPAAGIAASSGASGASAGGATVQLSGTEGDALDAFRARVAAGDRDALGAVGVAVESAAGAREMTGEAAPDERVATATVVARAAAGAALLVTTTCGNAALATVRWDGVRWVAAERVPLVTGMHPGRCGQTEATAEAVPLASDARTEVVVVVAAQDATGESVAGPALSVYQLRAAGVLGALLRDVPYGSVNDATGATTTGQYYVVADAPAPRDLYVAIRPGRRGPGGAPASEIVRRRYALHGARLEMVQQVTEPAE